MQNQVQQEKRARDRKLRPEALSPRQCLPAEISGLGFLGSMVAYSPHIRSDGFYLRRCELRAAHCRHGAAILFRRRYTVGDGFGDSFPAAVAPEPFVFGQVRAERRSTTGVAVASGAGSSADLAMIDAIAERDHLMRRSRWYGESRITGVSVRTLGRLGGSAYGFAGRGGEAGTRSEAGLCGSGNGPTDI